MKHLVPAALSALAIALCACILPATALADQASPSATAPTTASTTADEAPAGADLQTLATDWAQSGTCEWRIDENGVLTVRPANGASSGTLGTWESYGPPWYSQRKTITSVRFEKTVYAQTCAGMFYGCINATSIDLTGLNTSKVTSMEAMFRKCQFLASLDLSSLDTSNVTTMTSMFRDMYSMKSISLKGLNTSKVTRMDYLFCETGCTSIDVSGIDTSNVTTMAGMFADNATLTSINLTGLSTSSVTDMTEMFLHCLVLNNVDLSSFNTSKVTSMSYMFRRCEAFTEADLSTFDFSSCTNTGALFSGCLKLTKVHLPQSLKSVGRGAFNQAPLADVYFAGTKSDRASMSIEDGNESLTNATWHYVHAHQMTSKGCSICGAGDLNGNGHLDIVDAQVIFDIACGKYAGDSYASLRDLADINSDEAIDAVDARAIQILVLG